MLVDVILVVTKLETISNLELFFFGPILDDRLKEKNPETLKGCLQ